MSLHHCRRGLNSDPLQSCTAIPPGEENLRVTRCHNCKRRQGTPQCESTRTHISRKNLRTSELILRGKNELTKIPKNILKNGKLEGYDLKMAWLNLFSAVGKKSQLKNKEQLQIYFENSHKYIETRPPLAYITFEEANFKKSWESLEIILMLRLIKQKILRRRKPIEIIMLQKKKCKNNVDSVLCSVKERKFSKESTNIYNKNQHRIFSDEEAINTERKDQHMGFKKYGQLSKASPQRSSFLSTEKMRVQKRKTTKKSVTENQKFPFTYLFTHLRSSNSILKIFSTYSPVLPNTGEKKQFALKREFFRNQNLIRKQASVLRAKKSKSGKNGLDALSKYYYIELYVINLVFPSITSTVGARCELLSSQLYTCKAESFYMMEMLKHLIIASQRVKKKYFNIAQKGFRISALKTEMARKHHGTEENLPAMLHLHKHAFQGPSVIQRTKRSAEAKEETIPVSVNYLKRLTSALVAGATLFGLALSALALAACYLYYNRRNLGQFISALTGEESQNRAKSTDAPLYTPFSLSQNFHFQQPQESSNNRTPVATVTEAFSKAGSDMVTIKEIYRNTDTEESLNASHKGFSIRSRAFVSQSRSSGSIGSVFDEAPNVSSAQLSSADEIIKELEFSVLSNSNPKEKASVSAAYLPYHRSCDYQEHGTPYGVLKKPRISKSKSENDIIMSSSSKEVRAVHSVTMLNSMQNP
ncbi:uncharacterized protein [Tiliqua scincoides]|uniref:uncharacterized protein isoform X1 n=1 Tax=Tiliqua scincoides TaxID=71010 RepID=UPI00346321C1